MRDYLINLISGCGLSISAASLVADGALIICVIALSLFTYYAARKIALRAVVKYIMNNLEQDTIFLENSCFNLPPSSNVWVGQIRC